MASRRKSWDRDAPACNVTQARLCFFFGREAGEGTAWSALYATCPMKATGGRRARLHHPMCETPTPRVGHQSQEIVDFHVDQRFAVACLEVDVFVG